MRPFTSTISIDEARAPLRGGVRPIARTERVAARRSRWPRRRGRHRVDDRRAAIRPVGDGRLRRRRRRHARRDAASARPPAHRRSHVHRQRTVARSTPGTCAEIATGAPLPDGADAVVMVEQTAHGRDRSTICVAGGAARQNIGRRGADISPGDLVVRRGDLLNPSRLGAVAAIGCARRRGLRQAARRDSLDRQRGRRPGHAARPRDRSTTSTASRSAPIVDAHGGIAEAHAPARDTLEALDDALDACAGADVIVFSGGSSVGERDLIVDLDRRAAAR